MNRKIRKLLQLEALGAELLVVSADVADAGQMATAVSLAYERSGSIHGVIHGAGNTAVRRSSTRGIPTVAPSISISDRRRRDSFSRSCFAGATSTS